MLEQLGRGLEQRGIEVPAQPLTSNALIEALGGVPSYTGKTVSVKSALEGTIAVYACVRIIASGGSLPIFTYKREGPRNRPPVEDDPTTWPGRLARMLKQFPNPEMTAQEFWELEIGHAAAWGDGFANVVRDGSGRPGALWPLRPDSMEIFRDDDGEKRYLYTLPSGERRKLRREEVLHIPALSFDGVRGLSPISVARNAIAIEQAGAEYVARFFGQSAIPGGVFSAERKMSPDEKLSLKDSWMAAAGGMSNAHRLAVLDSGIKWQQIGLPPKDTQFVELRRFQIGEIARLYQIPPHMVGDVERSTSWGTGIQEMTIGFVVYTLRPWLERIEQRINLDLGLVPGQKTLLDENLFAEFKVDGLLRGDQESRYEAYATGIQWGFLTREDVRALENLPPIPGLEKPLVAANMTPLGEAPPESNGNGRDAVLAAYEQHLHQLKKLAKKQQRV